MAAPRAKTRGAHIAPRPVTCALEGARSSGHFARGLTQGRRGWLWHALLCAALVLSSALSAGAQESAQALASRALFDEARRLMAEGRHAEACVKFEESQRLRSGIGTQFNLAECYEQTGRVASAWSLYLRVAAETKSLGQPEREEVARTRAAALEARLARLTIKVTAPVDGLQLELDGAAMNRATWGIAVPLDPGKHSLVARAAGHETWRGEAVVPEGPAEIMIAVPKLAASAGSTRAAPPLQTAPTRRAAAGTERRSPSLLARRMPYIVGGVGAASVVLGGLLGLRAISKNGEAEEICVDRETRCPPDQIQRHSDLTAAAHAARTAGYLTFGLGLVGIGVGAAWVLRQEADADARAAQTLTLQTRLGAAGLGAELTGSF
jgi:serine/threonine-protein kinase